MTKFTNEELVEKINATDNKKLRDLYLTKLDAQMINQVRKLAHRYKITNTQFEDRVQNGRIGMLESIKTYDASKGVAFSTHAYNRIKANIIREGNREGNMIQTSDGITETRMKLNIASNAIIADEGRFPKPQELADICNVKVELVINLLEGRGNIACSLDAPITGSEGEEMSAYDQHGGQHMIAELLSEHNKQLLIRAVEILAPSEKFIVECILGLSDDGEAYSCSELVGIATDTKGNTLETRGTVHRHYRNALAKIQSSITVAA